MLDKLKLFKNNNERPVSGTTTTTTGKRTSSSSGVSSAKSERSDSSVSLDVKPMVNRSNCVRVPKQQKTVSGGSSAKGAVQSKGSPNSGKREVVVNSGSGSSAKSSLEKHTHKLANLSTVSKNADVKVKVSNVGSNKQVGGGTVFLCCYVPTSPQYTIIIVNFYGNQYLFNSQMELVTNNNKLPSQPPGTGIPKPTAAVKGTSKSTPTRPAPISRDSSHSNLSTHSKVSIAAVSPMKNKTEQQQQQQQLSESSGHQSNSSESSSVICKRDQSTEEIPPPPPPDPPKEAEKQQPGEEEAPSLNIEPMRPLLRGYCSTLTLPSRQHGRQYGRLDGLGDYCEIGIVNGYMSDGEMVKNQARRDLTDGYVSEGGAVLYSRRLQTMPTG